MSRSCSNLDTDFHIDALVQEIYDLLRSMKEHQMKISTKQVKSVETSVGILEKMMKRQGKIIDEIKKSSSMQQLRYEATLNILAEQQRQIIECLEKQANESFVNVFQEKQ